MTTAREGVSDVDRICENLVQRPTSVDRVCAPVTNALRRFAI